MHGLLEALLYSITEDLILRSHPSLLIFILIHISAINLPTHWHSYLNYESSLHTLITTMNLLSNYHHNYESSFEFSSIQLSSTISRTLLLYSRLSLSYNCDASALAGDDGLGSHNNDCIDVNIAEIS